ncbi:MAG: hypothetical protein Q7J78_01260 [Clostridiales bacterium]|nr:hypothetical protein [Clostridiales bacterium]
MKKDGITQKNRINIFTIKRSISLKRSIFLIVIISAIIILSSDSYKELGAKTGLSSWENDMTGVGLKADAETETDTEKEIKANAETKSKADTGVHTNAEALTGVHAYTEADISNEVAIGSGTRSDADSDTESETEPDTEPDTEPETEPINGSVDTVTSIPFPYLPDYAAGNAPNYAPGYVPDYAADYLPDNIAGNHPDFLSEYLSEYSQDSTSRYPYKNASGYPDGNLPEYPNNNESGIGALPPENPGKTTDSPSPTLSSITEHMKFEDKITVLGILNKVNSSILEKAIDLANNGLSIETTDKIRELFKNELEADDLERLNKILSEYLLVDI